MNRRALCALVVLVAMTATAVPAGAQDDKPPAVPDALRAYSIVPPGQEGDVTPPELAAGDFGEHYQDQLAMYASLVDDDDVTEEELSNYFHSMQFGLPQTSTATPYAPNDGSQVFRDEFGIPHIYADSTTNAAFALGYVTAEDRLWEADVLRHAARGTLSQFIGPDYLEMDIATRRDGYTEEEIQKMFDDLDDKFGETGKAVQDGLTAYSEGFNAYLGDLAMTPQQCPAEYTALNNPCPGAFPTEWSPSDTLFLVVLQLRVFGETAGGELNNAALYSHLVKKHGAKLGPKIFEDLLFQNDRRSPTSIAGSEGKFPSQPLGKTKAKALAIPDQAEEIARRAAAADRSRKEFLSSIGFRAPASNSLLVSGKESETGNPLHIGAPQVGYAVPSFFMDIDVHAPGLDFRGPAVPGASALIPLGRGRDYAWSLTTGYSDAVDVRAELLCDPEGGEVTTETNSYQFNGECKAMESRDEMFIVKPSAGSTGPPNVHTETFYRTGHGPVFERGTVDGKPVAFVKERYFWMKEIDSIPAFYRWNSQVTSLQDFKEAASEFTMSFNTFYADAEHIAYFHVGLYPQRKKGVHPGLPVWGTGKWEWKAQRFPFSKHPQVIDPEQGWVANWNNKPSVGWNGYDGIKWGAVQRVALLGDQMRKLLKGTGKAELSDIVDVIRIAATQDTRGVYLGRKMVKWGKASEKTDAKDAAALVSQWVKAGAHRYNRDHNETMDGPALPIFDEWYKNLVHLVFDDELGEEGYGLMAPMGSPITDYSPAGGSSFWADFSNYLSNLFSKKASKGYALHYCDNTGTKKRETCKQLVVKALETAVAGLKSFQGEDMSKWSVPEENIVFSELGLGSVDPIPWQNRGTHNHVVEILEDLPPAAP